MSFKEWFGKLKVDLKNFLVYLITEPFIQIYETFKLMLTNLDPFGKPKGLAIIFTIFIILSILAKNAFLIKLFITLALISIIKYLWDRPEWREKAKRRMLNRYQKVEEKNGMD